MQFACLLLLITLPFLLILRPFVHTFANLFRYKRLLAKRTSTSICSHHAAGTETGRSRRDFLS